MVVSGQPSGKLCDFNSDTDCSLAHSTPIHSAALKQLSQARNLYKFFTLTSKQCEKFALDAAAAIVDAEVCLLPWRPF